MPATEVLQPVVYWHRDLPPIKAEPMEDHVIEADSLRVPGTIVDGDELWDRCQADLMTRLSFRLEQEIRRLGGRYAHVLDERIVSKHDAVRGEAWLHGVFSYMLYR